MSPDNEPQKPIPIDPPDNTLTGSADDDDPDASEVQALAIDPPDNTGA
jgi:hypothetical protein